MSYPSLAPNRSSYDRRRRRRRIIMVAVVGIVVALLTLAVRYRTEERRATEYMALATQIAETESGVATSLTQMLTDLGSLERQDLLDQIEALGNKTQADVAALATQDVAATVAEAHGFLTVALGAWQDAFTSLDDAVLLILDSPDDDLSGEAALESFFDLLRVGDRAYAGFLEARSRVEGPAAAGSIAEFEYVDSTVANLFDGEIIASRLRGTRNLGGRHDISVTARTQPDPLGTSNGRPVVPASETFSVLAVVTNEGNLPEESIVVTFTLMLGSGEGEPVTREQLILLLDAGEATTVEFADLELIPGGLYDLRITASIAEDADPLNNIFELLFIRNQDS